jgi:hypothetical protein
MTRKGFNCSILTCMVLVLGSLAIISPEDGLSPVMGYTRTYVESGTLVAAHFIDSGYPYNAPLEVARVEFSWMIWYTSCNEWEVELHYYAFGSSVSANWGTRFYQMSPLTGISSWRDSANLKISGGGADFTGPGRGGSFFHGGQLGQQIDIVATAAYSRTSFTQQHAWATLRKPSTSGGGCPYAAPWNGQDYVPENNLLMTSERFWPTGGTDVDDYYHFINPIAPKENHYSVAITEFENEQSFLDSFSLITVDHARRTKIAVDPHGNILTFRHPRAPHSAVDGNGNNVKQLIKRMDDEKSFLGFPGDSIVIQFPRILREQAKLVLRADAAKLSIHVQLLNEVGEWYTIEEVHPRAYQLNNEIVDLSDHVIFGQPLKVRLFWTDMHYLDFVGIDTSAPVPVSINTVSLASAVDATGNDITSLLAIDDGQYAELIPGESLYLNFPTTPQSDFGHRDFVLYANGYYIPYVASL